VGLPDASSATGPRAVPWATTSCPVGAKVFGDRSSPNGAMVNRLGRKPQDLCHSRVKAPTGRHPRRGKSWANAAQGPDEPSYRRPVGADRIACPLSRVLRPWLLTAAPLGLEMLNGNRCHSKFLPLPQRGNLSQRKATPRGNATSENQAPPGHPGQSAPVGLLDASSSNFPMALSWATTGCPVGAQAFGGRILRPTCLNLPTNHGIRLRTRRLGGAVFPVHRNKGPEN